MRNKLGALLCVALGGVLIFSALDNSASGAVGMVQPNCGDLVVGLANPGTCPTGTIRLTETTDLTANPAATAPSGGWEVKVEAVGADPCNLPTGGTTQHVADGDSVDFENLYIFRNAFSDDYCQYQITETAVDGFSASYNPTAPYSFVYVPAPPSTETTTVTEVPSETVTSTVTDVPSGTVTTTVTEIPRVARPRDFQGASPLSVTLTNVAAAAPTSSAPTTKSSSASASPTTVTTSVIACGDAVRGQYKANRCPGPIESSDSGSAAPVAASTSPALANTGPSRPVKPSLFIGAALVLLGGVLLIAGRRRPRGEHA